MITIADHEAPGLARGVSDYLVKPIDCDRLAAALDKYRRRKHQSDNLLIAK